MRFGNYELKYISGHVEQKEKRSLALRPWRVEWSSKKRSPCESGRGKQGGMQERVESREIFGRPQTFVGDSYRWKYRGSWRMRERRRGPRRRRSPRRKFLGRLNVPRWQKPKYRLNHPTRLCAHRVTTPVTLSFLFLPFHHLPRFLQLWQSLSQPPSHPHPAPSRVLSCPRNKYKSTSGGPTPFV